MTPTTPLSQDLWESLPGEARTLIDTMRLQIDLHQSEVHSLKNQLATNSSNSSMPPSSDPIHTKRRPPQPPSGKKRGGQPGHQRATRPLVPPDQLHDSIACKPESRAGCGATLAGDDPQPRRHRGCQARAWRHRVCRQPAGLRSQDHPPGSTRPGPTPRRTRRSGP